MIFQSTKRGNNMQKISNIGKDKTIEKNYIQKWQFLIQEYLLVKKGKHSRFRFVSDFYRSHNTNRQTFCKYYNRYLNSGIDKDLLPRKRGPKWQSRIASAEIESLVLLERRKGLNKYEICLILKPQLGDNNRKRYYGAVVNQIFLRNFCDSKFFER